MLRVERPRSVQAFLDLAGPYLEAREAEHNLLFGVSSTLLANPELFLDAPRFWIVRGAGDEVIGAALHTPPRQLLISLLGDKAAAPALADAMAADEAAAEVPTAPAMPGVAASPEVAQGFVERWLGAHPGLTGKLRMHEGIYRLRQVIEPSPARGRARIATRPDRRLIADWLDAFALEAFGEPMTDAAVFADRWIRQVTGRRMWLWEIEAGPRRRGTVVSFAGVSGPTPHGIRIGPVYTPPEHRRQGYAGNLVAAASAAQLAAGRAFCFLFTDLANPTSNHVYQQIGYEPIGTVDQWVFERRSSG